MPGYANPQVLNHYSYVLNNPVKLNDPTGHKCVGEAEECEDEDGHPVNGAGGFGGNHSPSAGAGPHSTVVYDFQYFPEAPWSTNVYPLDYAQMQEYCYRHFGPNVECGRFPTRIGNPVAINLNIDAVGFRIEASGWIVKGGDVNIDFLYFGPSNEARLFVSPGTQTGGDGGAALTGGILIAQNTPGSGSYEGVSNYGGGHIPAVPLGIDLEGEHSVSVSPNSDGTYLATTYIGSGPLQAEVGGYTGISTTVSITDIWNFIIGK